MTLPKVYIAGPMRGYPSFNFPAFDEAAMRGTTMGWTVLSPADHDRSLGLDETQYPTGDMLKVIEDGFDMNAARDWDVEQVLKNADAVAMLPGWEKSVGARAEAALAVWRDIPVLDATTFRPFPPSPERAGDPRFHAMLKLIGDLHDKKQQDYGSKTDPFANVRASEEFGVQPWVGALVRLNDKVTRLKQFARRGTLANESAKDSMLDISVYALIAYILYEEVETDNNERA